MRQPNRWSRWAIAALVAVELFVVGCLGLLAVLGLPDLFEVEWFCLDSSETKLARAFEFVFFIGLVVSWVLVAGTTAVAFRGGRPRLGFLLPVLWCAAITLLALLVLAAIGPQPCGVPGVSGD